MFKSSLKGEKNPNWKGGRRTTNGYVYILMPDHPRANKRGYVKRSRLVAEKTLGRYLYPNEIPHHRNEIKGDDRPENIKVLTSYIHKSFHSKNRKRVAEMKKIVLGFVIVLFCLSIGMTNEQLSTATQKELDEFLMLKGLLIGKEHEKALDNFLRSKGFLWEGFTPKVETMELILREIIRHNIEGKGIEPHDFSWFEKSKEFYYKTCMRLERETLLKKQEEENTKLQRLVWELDNIKSDIRLELDFMQDYYLFMPYLWNNSCRYPSSRQYFTTPNFANYFWLNYYRRKQWRWQR